MAGKGLEHGITPNPRRRRGAVNGGGLKDTSSVTAGDAADKGLAARGERPSVTAYPGATPPEGFRQPFTFGFGPAEPAGGTSRPGARMDSGQGSDTGADKPATEKSGPVEPQRILPEKPISEKLHRPDPPRSFVPYDELSMEALMRDPLEGPTVRLGEPIPPEMTTKEYLQALVDTTYRAGLANATEDGTVADTVSLRLTTRTYALQAVLGDVRDATGDPNLGLGDDLAVALNSRGYSAHGFHDFLSQEQPGSEETTGTRDNTEYRGDADGGRAEEAQRRTNYERVTNAAEIILGAGEGEWTDAEGVEYKVASASDADGPMTFRETKETIENGIRVIDVKMREINYNDDTITTYQDSLQIDAALAPKEGFQAQFEEDVREGRVIGFVLSQADEVFKPLEREAVTRMGEIIHGIPSVPGSMRMHELPVYAANTEAGTVDKNYVLQLITRTDERGRTVTTLLRERDAKNEAGQDVFEWDAWVMHPDGSVRTHRDHFIKPDDIDDLERNDRELGGYQAFRYREYENSRFVAVNEFEDRINNPEAGVESPSATAEFLGHLQKWTDSTRRIQEIQH